MPDREKMIQALENADAISGVIKMSVEVRDILVALLKEQDAIVRCKDCKHRETIYCPFYQKYKGTKYDDWFCADGERRDDDA